MCHVSELSASQIQMEAPKDYREKDPVEVLGEPSSQEHQERRNRDHIHLLKGKLVRRAVVPGESVLGRTFRTS